jgi:hypothetical protein
MDQKHRLARSAIEAPGVLIGHGADQDDCLLLGVVAGTGAGVWFQVTIWIFQTSPSRRSCGSGVFDYSAFFRGSSAGLMKVISNGPVGLATYCGTFEPQLLFHRLSVMIGLLGANLVALHLSEARARQRNGATCRWAAVG